MTNQEQLQAESGAEPEPFTVRCISCGMLMRKDRTEDSFGKCWKCFYTAINDYLRAQRGHSNPLFASDR